MDKEDPTKPPPFVKQSLEMSRSGTLLSLGMTDTADSSVRNPQAPTEVASPSAELQKCCFESRKSLSGFYEVRRNENGSPTLKASSKSCPSSEQLIAVVRQGSGASAPSTPTIDPPQGTNLPPALPSFTIPSSRPSINEDGKRDFLRRGRQKEERVLDRSSTFHGDDSWSARDGAQQRERSNDVTSNRGSYSEHTHAPQ